jgi:hypothetical protein
MTCVECDEPAKTKGRCRKHYMKHYHRNGPDRRYGGDLGYKGVHHRLRRLRGPARDHLCACGEQAAEWAFDEPTGFSNDLSRYRPECQSCHKKGRRGA